MLGREDGWALRGQYQRAQISGVGKPGTDIRGRGETLGGFLWPWLVVTGEVGWNEAMVLYSQ